MKNIDQIESEQAVLNSKKFEILRTRAKELAKTDDAPEESGESLLGLSILLSDETYLLYSEYVTEVLPLNEITPLPCTPAFILGIINVRGRILSVINLKNFLGLPERGITNLNRVIVAKFEDIEVGLLADEVLNHQSVSIHKLQTELPMLSDIQREFITGITAKGEIVFNLKGFLSSKKIIVQDEI